MFLIHTKSFWFISTKTGLKPFCITDAISDIHVSVGTIISPLPLRIFKQRIDNKLAEDPELTNTLYLQPSHFDQFFQIILLEMIG